MSAVESVSVHEALEKLKEPETVLLDVREQDEYDFVHLEESLLIPLGKLEEKAVSSLDREKVYLVLCRSGGRSLRAAELLLSLGFERVYNVRGGIHAWACEIDPSLPVY